MRANGSVQQIDNIPDDIKELYKTAWELSMKDIIDMSRQRGYFIDQSQSLNLFMEGATMAKLTSMHFYAWKSGLKTKCIISEPSRLWMQLSLHLIRKRKRKFLKQQQR